MGINVLSAFDGISVGRMALEDAGIKVDNYFTCEIDPYATAISDYHYPDNIKLGDITTVNVNDLPKIDLLFGGFPCQSFSMAGKGLNFEDPRGRLFFNLIEILNNLRAVNPDVKFLFENVKMKKDVREEIDNVIGVQPVLINSALVSAQNRLRNYWTNLGEIPQPEDQGILLKHVLLDENVGALGAAQRGRNIVDGKRKDYLGAPTEQRIEINNLEKSNCLTTVQKDSLVLALKEDPQVFSNVYGGFKETEPRVHTGKSPTIRTASGGGHIPSTIDLSSLYLSDKAIDYMCRPVKSAAGNKEVDHFTKHPNYIDGKSGTLTANMFKGVPYGVIKELLRRLHPIECERLQTLPDDYTKYGNFNGKVKEVSNTRRYHAIGNAWTMKVISHILKEGSL